MGILMVSIAGAIVLLAAILSIIEKTHYPMMLCGLIVFLFIPITTESMDEQKPSEYLYSARISKGYIYFDDFFQQDNVITIDNYAAGGKTHWSDFKNYDVMNETLTIQLTDNLNRFEYKEIKTGKVFNKRIATQ